MTKISNLKVEKIKEYVTKEELKKHLANLTSEDFNSRKSCVVNIDGVETKVSPLDSYMLDYIPEEVHNPIYKKYGYLVDFIETILSQNVLEEVYDYKIETFNDHIVVSVTR